MKCDTITVTDQKLDSVNQEKTSWSNQAHKQFYENVPIEKFMEIINAAGIEDCCDIQEVKDIVFNAKTILDIGAGHGRVTKHLLENNYNGKITAIERSNNFCEYLNEHFGNKIEIINKNFLEFKSIQKYDVVLFMWSNISEFPKKDQLNVINELASFLNPKGTLIIDTLLHTLNLINEAAITTDQNYSIKSLYGPLYGYMTSSDEIDDYAATLGLTVEHKHYLTKTSRQRILHLIRYP